MGGKLITEAKEFSGFIVPVERLQIYPETHPRFDARSRYEPAPEMVANVKARGIIQPVKVQVIKDATEYEGTDGRTHELAAGIYVLDGHQRRGWALAAQAELRKEGERGAEVMVPVIAERSKDEDYLASLSIAANQRVSDEPLVIAEKLRAVVDRYGGDIGRAAAMTGYTPTFVRQHVALLGLDKSVRKAVEKGDLAVSAAAPLAKMEPAEQKRALDVAMAAAPAQKDGRRKAAVTVRDVTRAAKVAKGETPATEAPSRKQVREMFERATGRGEKAIARTLHWVLTGEGDPLA